MVERDFKDMLYLLPNPDGLNLNKMAKNSAIMTDTCNGAKLSNQLLAHRITSISGNVLSLLCYNHLRNVWVKNVQEAVSAFVRNCLHESLDEMAIELQINPSLLTLARAFDKDIFHSLPEELRLAAVIASMESAPATRRTNNDALERLREVKQRKEEIAKEKETTKSSHHFIRCLTYHSKWNTDQCWKTAEDVKLGLMMMTYIKDKEEALKENINIHYLGLGWNDCHTTWSKDGKKKSVDVLTSRLIENIDMTSSRCVPDGLEPVKYGTKRKDMPILGHLTAAAKYLNKKSCDDFELNCRTIWSEKMGDSNMSMLQHGDEDTNLNDSLIGKRIEYMSEFASRDDRILRWCGGVIEDICDRGEAAWVLWDGIPEEGYEESRTLEPFEQSKFNGSEVGAWRILA